MDPENHSRPSTPASIYEGHGITRRVDSSSDSELRGRRSRSPAFSRRTQNRFLYLDRKDNRNDSNVELWNEAEQPAIIWSANVYDVNDDTPKSHARPVVNYVDDRPLDLKTMPSHANATPAGFSTISNDDQETHTPFPKWEGVVFNVKVQALANFATRRPSNRVDDRSGYVRNARQGHAHIPSKPDLLQVEALSRTSVVIHSPFLCTKLVDAVGYYPSFLKNVNRELLDLSHSSAGATYSGLKVFEPYAAFMHNFSQIADFAESKGPDHSAGESGPESGEKCQKPEDERVRLQIEHVKQLYDFLKPQHDALVLPIQEQLKKDHPRVTFDMLWYVFKPGTDVYVDIAGSIQTCVVKDLLSNYDNDETGFSEAQIRETRLRYYVLDLWYLDTDGTKIGRVSTTRRIEAFTGFKDIVQVEACPVSIWDKFDKGERRQRILRRSKLLLDSLRQGYLLARYDGLIDGRRQYVGSVVIDFKKGLASTKTSAPTLGRVKDFGDGFVEYDNILVKETQHSGTEVLYVDSTSDSSGDESSRGGKRVYEERVPRRPSPIIRSASAQATAGSVGRQGPSISMGKTSQGNKSHLAIRGKSKGAKHTRKDLDEHQLLLLSPMSYAFTLKTKQWFEVDVEYVHEIAPSDLSMKNLVLGESELETIRGLSSRQNSKRDVWAADFIEGKGTGQIILLHGPPGVGKTYTVEAIAEWLHRPLLALTVADIGTVETRVERELIKWFSLAEGWNAVLLVDEADIFLERRQNRDLARNGLVSAFLRRMEYFKGLLFLTTNRVGQIDDAFISRVHIAIGYKTLTGPDRKKIWDGFLQKLVKERAGKIQVALSAKKWVLENAVSGKSLLNGRDIRNALQSAITLAEAESAEDPEFDPDKMAVVVDQSHFQRVLDISIKFHEYVKSIRREDEKKRAAGRLDRNDYYWQGESG